MSARYQFDTLQVTVDDHVATVTLNRPDVLNAVNMPMYEDLFQAFNQLDDDDSVWVIVLTGSGRAFSVGADLKERQTMTVADVRRRRRLAPRTFGAVANCRKPVIGAIHGYAMGGGCELALCCDLLMAAEGTVFALPETAIGVIPGGGGTQRLPRLVGPMLAKELIFTGRRFSAQQAFEYGMLSRVVPADELLAAAQELAREICQSAPLAVYQAKKAINATFNVGLEAGLLYEAEAYDTCLSSEDRLEGLAAFREKRKPQFKGR